MSSSRLLTIALVLAALVAGVYFWSTNLRRPAGGRETQVADAPAGGRTQAEAPLADAPDAPGGLSASGSAVDAPGDPLVPGVSEHPDIPPDQVHIGIKKIGQRIRDAVLVDGRVGDDEVPGVQLAGLSQSQRRWFLQHAVAITCPCGCRQDLLECRRDDASCPTSPGLSDSLLAVARQQR